MNVTSISLLLDGAGVAQESSDRSQRGAKYAAMLCMSAMDPTAAHKDAAFRGLRDFVLRRRCTTVPNNALSAL